MPRPSRPPIGRHLAQTARLVSRAFDDALGAGFSGDEVADLEALLSRLEANVT